MLLGFGLFTVAVIEFAIAREKDATNEKSNWNQ